MRSRFGAVAAVVTVACFTSCSDTRGGKSGAPGGTMVIVTTGDADILFPPLVATSMGRQVTEQIYDYLAEVGTGMNTIGDRDFRPQLARSWEWSPDSLAIRFHIHPGARWHDGRPVRASDIQFTFRLYTDSLLGSSAGSQLGNIDSVATPDSLTAVFWFRKRTPFQFFDATNQMQILPQHVFGGFAIDSLRRIASGIPPVGSGRFRFVSWERQSSIEIVPDSANYRGSAGLRRVIWSYTPSAVTASTQLLAGAADLYDTMRPENVREAATRSHVRVMSSPGSDYVFMQFNFRDPRVRHRPHRLFASRELRRALSIAVNREDMVRNVFDSLARPAIGPTIRAYPTTDTTIDQLPYDPALAARVLDSLGWRLAGRTGIRERNGEKLRFSILVPASSLNRKKMGVLLQEQLRKLGVAVDLDELEWGTFETRLSSREFDAALGSWHLGASAAALKETWTGAAARNRGGLNYGSYINPLFDAYVDSATTSMDLAASRRYYTAAYRIAIEDAPAIWLYEPLMVLGIHRRIRTGAMRPDAWWSSLGDWVIPPGEQIERDWVRQ